jgi:hypothetical protein
MPNTQSPKWNVQLKLASGQYGCQVESSRAVLTFQAVVETRQTLRSSGNDEHRAREEFAARFRTERAWQQFERLKTRLMTSELELVDAETEAADAAAEYSGFVALGEDGEISRSQELMKTFQRTAIELRSEVAALRKAAVEAFNEAEGLFQLEWKENLTVRTAEAKQAVLDVLTKIGEANNPLLNEYRDAFECWQSLMSPVFQQLPTSLLGMRPVEAPQQIDDLGPITVFQNQQPLTV